MQRIIGGILVIAATSGIGFLYSKELQIYLEKMLYIRHLIYLLKGELEYCVAPIGEVFGKIAQQVKQPYKNWLLAMQKQVENREADEFFTIWMRTIDQYLGELSLKPSHLIQLKELGCYLGQNHTAVESRNLQLYIERLELEIEKMREGIETKRRIGSCLGVMAGIFLVVILL